MYYKKLKVSLFIIIKKKKRLKVRLFAKKLRQKAKRKSLWFFPGIKIKITQFPI